MRIPEAARKLLLRWCIRRMNNSVPNRRIPPDPSHSVYMFRWWIWRVRWLSSLYLNEMHRSDDDRALHDHPWLNASIILEGGYFEHMPGGKRVWRAPGDIVIRWKGSWLHRLELATENGVTRTALSLFFTGPARRRWGFNDPQYGWIDARDWEDFNRSIGRAPGNVGRGRSQFAVEE